MLYRLADTSPIIQIVTAFELFAPHLGARSRIQRSFQLTCWYASLIPVITISAAGHIVSVSIVVVVIIVILIIISGSSNNLRSTQRFTDYLGCSVSAQCAKNVSH